MENVANSNRKKLKVIEWLFFQKKTIVLLLAIILLYGCKVEVYQGLNEMQANAMLATLLKHGIVAEKQNTGKAGYTIRVDKSRLAESLELLRESGFPKEQYKSLGSIFSGEGMIASASEDQARLSYALSQELAGTFSRISGILSARVHVALASGDQEVEQRTPASAAIFLLHTPSSPVVNLVPKIRELTSMSVPELSPDKVSVVLVPVRESITIPTVASLSSIGDMFFSNGHATYVLIILAGIIVLMMVALLYLNIIFWKHVWIAYRESKRNIEN